MEPIPKGHRWCIDTETDGLWPTRFWCISLIDIDAPDNRLFFGPAHVNQAIESLCSEASLIVGHNVIGYDLLHARRLLGVPVRREIVRDTLVMSRLANSARKDIAKAPHSIEAWGSRFGHPKVKHEDWSQFSPDMQRRCEEDTFIGFMALKAILKELKGVSQDSLVAEHDLAWLLADLSERGFYLHQDRAFNLMETARKTADKLQGDIRRVFPIKACPVREVSPKTTKDGIPYAAQVKCLGPSAKDAGGPFTLIQWTPFNVDSPAQRVERLLAVGWKPVQKTPAGNPKFDEKDLSEDLPPEARLIGSYLMCRSRERLASQWLDLVDPKGFVHGTIHGIGTKTHRMSHTDPNFANIPKVAKDKATKEVLWGLKGRFGADARHCWGVANERTQWLLGCDLTAIQFRAFAHYTGDLAYIDLVSNHPDMHSGHAEYLGGVEREVAKTWIYAFLLGAGHGKLGSILGATAKEGAESSDLFLEKIPGLRTLKMRVLPRWVHQGFLVSLDGRRVPVPSTHLALSVALQSFEKVIMTHALISWTKENPGVKPVAIVHDEVQSVIDNPSEDVALAYGESFVSHVKATGERLKSLSPLTAEFRVGKTWAETH